MVVKCLYTNMQEYITFSIVYLPDDCKCCILRTMNFKLIAENGQVITGLDLM